MLRVVKGIEDALELRDWLIRQPEVAIDTETTGIDVFARDFRVRLTQFGSKTEAWVFPTEGWEGFIDQLIRQYSGRIIMHNSRYDILALERVGVHVPWWQVDDTMIALRLAAPHQSAALKTACTTHVSAGAAASQSDLHKAMKKQGWDWATVPLDFRPYYFYAAMDTVLTARLADTRICREGFSSPMYGLEMDLREICSVMERGGMRVDLGFCQESNTTLRLECEHRIDKMREEFGCEITSPTKLAKWLMTMGAKLRKRTAGGMPSTDRESLEMVLEDHPDTTDPIHVVASNALRVRDLTKLSSSYFDNFLGLHVDGLLHPSIETIAARTGRMSIRNPALQTLPRGDNPDAKMVRDAVIPRAEGQVLIGCDYEQIELRLMAAESGDPGLIEAFRAIDAGEVDVDFFTYTAREAFGDPEMAKSDPRRSTNKTLWYASSYGAGVAKMAASAGVPVDEMRETSKRVFRKYPGVKRLMKECEREAVENDNWIETPMGRRIWIDPAASYKALNGKIQGFAADLFKKAAVELGHAGLTEFMVVPVHDEMLFSIPEDIVDDVSPIIRETMTTAWKGVRLPADPSVGAKTWGSIPK